MAPNQDAPHSHCISIDGMSFSTHLLSLKRIECHLRVIQELRLFGIGR